MENNEREIVSGLTLAIKQLRQGQRVHFDFGSVEDSDSSELLELKQEIKLLAEQYNSSYNFILDVAAGKLDTVPPAQNNFANPFKQLHADLLHLTWQIQQISEGDYDQKVSFYGDFSRAINKMIESLKEKERIDKLNLQYMNELKELNAMKDKFFSIISHDLKNPFTGLLGFSDILLGDLKDKNYDSAQEYAATIKELSEQGYKLLVNLLEWSRLQRNSLKISIEKVFISTIVDLTTSIVIPLARQKNIKIIKEGNLGLYVLADVNMLNTVLRNLLTNAVKYTNEGGEIVVSASIVENMTTISVSDNGIGISSENISKLFMIDTNFSTKGTRFEDGTGLGLILCKEFVNKMGGDITVESLEGHGSTFKFSLPSAI